MSLESRLQSLLKDARFPDPPRSSSWNNFRRQAHRNRRAHFAGLMVTLGLVALVAVLGVAGLQDVIDRSPRSDAIDRLPPGTSDASPQESPRDRSASLNCPFPSVRPSYLPWLGEGEAPRPPSKYIDDGTKLQDEGSGYAALMWANPNSNGPDYVRLVTMTEDLAAEGVETEVSVDGDRGQLLPLDEASGGIVMEWEISQGVCNKLSLELVAPGLTSSEAANEIKTIAESLL